MLKLPTNVDKREKSLLDVNDTLCLICGQNGDHSTNIINPSMMGSASGTPLSSILRKIVGEELFYPLSKFICHQCFLLLDRLDAYEVKAAEIRSHIKERYKETKLQFTSGEKHITKLLESSLGDFKKYENGTTLDITDELSVTVFHDKLPRNILNKIKKRYDVISPKSLINFDEEVNLENEVKRKSNLVPDILHKKRKQNLFPRYRNQSDDNNNDNNSHDGKRTSCKWRGTLSLRSGDCDNIPSSLFPDCLSNDGGSPVMNDTLFHDNESVNSICGTDKSFSDLEWDLDVSKCNIKENGKLNSASHTIKASSDAESIGCFVGEGSNFESIERNENSSILNKLKHDCSETTPEDEDFIKRNQGIAEAVLLQNSLASNILHSFLSSSLWMNSSEVNKHASKNETDDEEKKITGIPDDKKTRLELKNAGRSYINTKGVLVEARKISPQDCSRCPLKCNQRVDEEMRASVFAAFWGLGDYTLQRKYLSSHMERVEKFGPKGLPRIVIFYYLTHKETKIQVCRQFFLKTLDVSEKASRIVLKKKLKGEL